MPRKVFQAPTSHDFKITEEGKVIGTLRVKPNGIAWKPKNKQRFNQITIEQLADFAAKEGRQVEN